MESGSTTKTFRSYEKRREVAIREADAAAAFDHVSDMELQLDRIEQAQFALRMLANDSNLDRCAQGALNLIADIIGETIAETEELRSQANHKLWAYHFAPDKISTDKRRA